MKVRLRRRTVVVLAIAVATLLLGVLLVGRTGVDPRASDDSLRASGAIAPSTIDPSTTVETTSSSSTPSSAGTSPQGSSTPSSRTGLDPAAVAAVDANGSAKVIVQLDVEPTGSPAERAAQVRVELDRVLASMPPGSYTEVARDLSVSTIPMTVDKSGLESLAAIAVVESVRATRVFEPVASSEAMATVQPSSTNATTSVGAATVWAAQKFGAGATVAVVDSGVDIGHGFLKATQKSFNEGCFGTTFVSNGATYVSPCPSGPMSAVASPVPGSAAPCQPMSAGCDHGTHVAGIAVGGTGATSVSGIAPAADLVAVSVFNYSSATGKIAADDGDIIRALNWLYNRKSSNFPTLAAVNLSLGGSEIFTTSCDDDPLKPAIDLLASADVATVVAAGNGIQGVGATNGVSSPACISTVIAVGAIDDSTGQSTSYSNDGPQVDVMAPGNWICSSVPSGAGASDCPVPNVDTMQYMNGTSMATPAVAGAIAQMKSAGIAPSEWRSRLQRVATGANCVQASSYTIPSLRVDVALGMTTQRAAPCAPSAPSASLTSATANSATVQWLAPIAVGTSAIVSYTATSTTGQSCVATAPAVSCVVANLPWSSTVRFTVTATSSTGTSGSSIQTGAVTTTTAPTTTAPPTTAPTTTSPPTTSPPTTSPPTTSPPTTSPPTTSPPTTSPPTTSPPTTSPPTTSPPTTAPPPPNMMVPVTPARLADSRPTSVGASTIDGQYLARGGIRGGTSWGIRVLGRGGVPSSGVGAVALNVTATNPTEAGFLTVYPSGAPRPTASSLNFTLWQTVPNLVISGVGGDGAVAVFNALGWVDVIVDVVGWYPAGGGYVALQPARLLETRAGLSTVDRQYNGGGAVPQGAAVSLVVAGRGGVPGNAGSVVLNVTATNPTAAGFLTVYPRGSRLPTASNLNFTPGQTVANSVIAAVGDAGRVEIFNALGSTDIVVDVVGWMPSGGQYRAMNPARLLETRGGLSTVDGRFNGTGALPPGAGLPLQVTGRAGIPAGARAVVVNVTATNPTQWGFFTVYSSSSPRPTASNLNFSPGQTVPNLVVCGVGGDGRIVLFNALGSTDAIVDVVGWYS